jgi:two-component system response regulator NreC
MATRVLLAGGRGTLGALRDAGEQIDIVGHVGTIGEAEVALLELRPSVLVLDVELSHHEGLCTLPALRRASPGTAIVLPPAGSHGPRLVRAVRMASHDFDRRRADDGLTLRERDVLRLIALGYSNAEAADHLTLSKRTVETHRARIQRRLGVSSRAELVRWALDRGLLDT